MATRDEKLAEARAKGIDLPDNAHPKTIEKALRDHAAAQGNGEAAATSSTDQATAKTDAENATSVGTAAAGGPQGPIGNGDAPKAPQPDGPVVVTNIDEDDEDGISTVNVAADGTESPVLGRPEPDGIHPDVDRSPEAPQVDQRQTNSRRKNGDPVLGKVDFDEYTDAELTAIAAECRQVIADRRTMQAVPTTIEIARETPVDETATDEYSATEAASVLDVDADQVLSYSIRQERNADGRRRGPKFLVAALSNGQKLAKKL